MSVLSFRCVVTPLNGTTPVTREDSWIVGADCRTLVLAAAARINAQPEECARILLQPDGSRDALFLEVTSPDASALVGPIGGGAPYAWFEPSSSFASSVVRRTCGHDAGPLQQPARRRLSLFGSLADLAEPPDTCFLAPNAYVLRIVHVGVPDGESLSSVRDVQRSAYAYQVRGERVQTRRVAPCGWEGVHLLSYSVAPERWRAADLRRVLALMAGVVPDHTRRRREHVGITQDVSRVPATPNWRARLDGLQVRRGNYIASLRLPSFPARALTGWMRPGDARHPKGVPSVCRPYKSTVW